MSLISRCKDKNYFPKLFAFVVKSIEKLVEGAAMPNVWYAKCHERAIVGVRESSYLCSVIKPPKFLDEPSGEDLGIKQNPGY